MSGARFHTLVLTGYALLGNAIIIVWAFFVVTKLMHGLVFILVSLRGALNTK